MARQAKKKLSRKAPPSRTPEQLEIAELQKKKRELIKEYDNRINAKKLEAKNGSIDDVWRKLQSVKDMVLSSLEEMGLSGQYDLKSLANKVPDYYSYQHPTKKILKSSDKTDAWVQDYLKKGDEDTLIETANNSRYEFFVKQTTKTRKRKGKSGSTSSDSPSSDTSQSEGIG